MTVPSQSEASPNSPAPRACLVMDKLGALGALLAAAAAPCCFPLLAAAGAALGLGVLQSIRGYMDYAIQGMAVLALLGNAVAWRQHHKRGPFSVAIAAVGLVFMAYYAWYHVALIYIGLSGLMIAALWNVVAKRRCASCRCNS